jgi:hypothetical protein
MGGPPGRRFVFAGVGGLGESTARDDDGELDVVSVVIDAEKRAEAARPLLVRLFAWARVEHRIRAAVGYLGRQRCVLHPCSRQRCPATDVLPRFAERIPNRELPDTVVVVAAASASDRLCHDDIDTL